MKKKSILVVDDEASMRKNLYDVLSEKGFNVMEAGCRDEALARSTDNRPDLAVIDINLPGENGIDIMREIKQMYSALPVIIFTAYGTDEKAIEAMKAGAFDYLEKPFDLNEFLMLVKRASEYAELRNELSNKEGLEDEGDTISIDNRIVGKSAKMKEIFKLIGRVAQKDVTVLIQGESGTGKELVADAIHKHSKRSDKPYVKINCGALSESLLESEIFGHEKGAYTGAESKRLGCFEQANGGTILLDEINNMPASLQVRLLRILQNNTFYRVGGEEPVTVDVRVIAATNKDIEHEVKQENFRKDLFYRLNVVRIDIPPLRDRLEDIPLLAEHFLKKYSTNKKFYLPDTTITKLVQYNWPGNVREFENAMQSAIAIARENIINVDNILVNLPEREHYFSYDDIFIENMTLKNMIADIEKKLIMKVLIHTNWNRTKTASILGINRRLLYTKMHEYGLEQYNGMNSN